MNTTREGIAGRALLGFLLLAIPCAFAQIEPVAAPSTPVVAGTIHGVVKSGNMPIPGAAVVVSADNSEHKISTWTDVDGSYSAPVAANGTYNVAVQMMAFANSAQKIIIDASHQNVVANFELTLLSRSHQVTPQPARRPTGQAPAQRGFQTLSALQNAAGQDASGNTMSDVVPSGMPIPGVDPNGATESIAVSGNTSNSFNSMSGDQLQERINDARQQGGGFGGIGNFGAPGGGPGGGGGFGGGGPGRAMSIGRRGFDINHPHGSIYYGIGDSALNAAPYALAGEPATNPGYIQNNFGGSIGGPLNIPKIYHGGDKTFFFVNYNGRRGENPFDQFSTVPTLLEREGNFSQTKYTSGAEAGQSVQIFNPTTRAPFANNTIPQINPTAAGLLAYIPLPNLTPAPGSFQNFHFVTSANNNSDDLNVRVNHTFGAAPAGGRRGGGRGAPRNNSDVRSSLSRLKHQITNPFPSVGGNTSVRSFDVPVGYVRSIRSSPISSI